MTLQLMAENEILRELLAKVLQDNTGCVYCSHMQEGLKCNNVEECKNFSMFDINFDMLNRIYRERERRLINEYTYSN